MSQAFLEAKEAFKEIWCDEVYKVEADYVSENMKVKCFFSYFYTIIILFRNVVILMMSGLKSTKELIVFL